MPVSGRFMQSSTCKTGNITSLYCMHEFFHSGDHQSQVLARTWKYNMYMWAGTAHTERHNQVTEIVYRNICGACVLEVPNSQWETMKVIAYNRAKVLWDFKVQTDKQLLASQPDIEVVDNEKKTAVVRDAIVATRLTTLVVFQIKVRDIRVQTAVIYSHSRFSLFLVTLVK